ncbi:hypothetical protein N8K70_09970 [Microbacterium betulae]|uniref:Uncharacterized protein n=1 Tax=Microbacterium betulae TaxID=2981139 RepID=A0AA97FDT8_9MICO|nr:hypothetical protein [Microbacterium sp. AB]WOF21716.1 hypothetical protein N8K70_09970 [Microbacterium sp. AB]
MLTILDGARTPPAYRVPWHVDRSDAPHPRVSNIASEPVDVVRAFIMDDTSPPMSERWGLVLPGEVCELCLCDRELASVIVSLAWFRPGEDAEYLWRFSL